MSDGQIKSYFDRWQRLEEEKAALSEDLKELFAEAKSNGYEPKAMRIAFKGKVKDDERTPDDEAFDAVVETYRSALDGPRAHPAPAHEKTLTNFQSAEALDAQTSAPAGAAPDNAPATHSPDPHSFMGEDGRPLTRIPAVGAKIGGSNAPAGQVAANGEASSDQGIQQASSAPQAGNEAGSESGLSVTFTNPKCLKPKTCQSVHSKTACFDCVMEYGKRPPEEQKRLWAEATGVAA